jgi:hypothetical protein
VSRSNPPSGGRKRPYGANVPVTLAYQDTPLETSTRRSWGWLVGLVAAAGVVVAAWPLSSWQMRQSVAVVSTGHMRCTGTTPVKVGSLPGPAYRLVPGMRCQISYKVTNSAPLTAHLETATFHLLGPQTGLALRAVNPDPHVGQAATADGVDAVYNLDRDLATGETATFRIETVFNPRGCNGLHNTVTFTTAPEVEVSFLNVSGTRTGDVKLAFVGTKASDCPNAG